MDGPDCDKIQSGELGLVGIHVFLLEPDDTFIALVATNADGQFRFEGLCAGDYKVVVDASMLSAGVMPTNQMVGDPSQDSNAARRW